MGQPTPPVRIVDVAALAGVAPSTVSKALNNTGALKDGTRLRVREAAARLGFVLDAGARSLSSRRSYTGSACSAPTLPVDSRFRSCSAPRTP